jgi:ADP-ribosylglycohydrolase
MDRTSGSLFGLAYGDALGKPTEFLTIPEIIDRYGDQGPRQLEGDPALVTDDTQMALAVAWALVDASPRIPHRHVPRRRWTPQVVEPLLRKRFIDWAHSPDNNRAPGNTCLSAIAGLADGLPWQRASVSGSKGCGANMRVTPVGLLPVDDDELADVAQFQAGLTHGHPTALAASELTAYAVKLLASSRADLADLPVALRERCRRERTVYRGDWLGDLWESPAFAEPMEFIAHGWDECLAVLDRLDLALREDTGRLTDFAVDPCELTGAGWVAEEALATALLCAIGFSDDPVTALARAATTSGDSDSIACLTGAFLGAAHGMSIWPSEWATRIEYADQLTALSTALPA